MKQHKKTTTLIAIAMVLVGGMTSCEKESKIRKATGTIIGHYYNNTFSFLVQVDSKYPIGKTLEYVQPACATFLPKSGTYRNLIQVQLYLPLPGWPETYLEWPDWSKIEPTLPDMINKRISFSYRKRRRDCEEDRLLFETGQGGNMLCAHPDVPFFIITDCQILN